MPLNHIYRIWEFLTKYLRVFKRINGNKKFCLSTVSAIANHKLSNIVKETVIPCLSFLLGIKLLLDTEIFTDTKLLLTTLWSDPAFVFLFWLSLITSSKCSETTRLPGNKSSLDHHKHWAVTFFLFISFITLICTIQLMRSSVPFLSFIYSNTGKKLRTQGIVFCGDLETKSHLKKSS